MNPFDLFETNEDEEIGGVWQNFGSFKVLLARSGGNNTNYFKELQFEAKKAGVATVDALEPKEFEEIYLNVFVKSVIKDHQVKNEAGNWEQGVYIKEDNQVKIVPYTNKNMKTCLKQLPEYFKKLQKWSDDYKTFQNKIEEEQEKN